MSFSTTVKEELIDIIPNSRHCRLSELSAILSMSGYFTTPEMFLNNDNVPINKKIDKLIHMLGLNMNSEESKLALKLKEKAGIYTIDRILIERTCCKQAYVRGAFLASGSITDPKKGYHMEFVCHNNEHAEILTYIIKEFGIESKVIQRKKYYVVYIKDGSMIVDVLNIMGAYKSLMGMENIRILKDMRNSVNRRVNCETANINKTVSAAVRQIEDIRYIEQTKGLKSLPDGLRILAEIRLDEPDLPLKELGERLDPPLGKSGVNHRLRKISEIADEIRRNY